MITWNVHFGGLAYTLAFDAFDGTQIQPTATSFALVENEFSIVVQGQFQKNIWGVITDGTVTGFKMYLGGYLLTSMTGYEIDYKAFNAARLDVASPALQELLVGQSMAVNGSDNFDVLFGSRASDVLKGFAGNDEISGRGGNDLIDGGEGKDRLYGDEGVDTVSYVDRADAVTVALDVEGDAVIKVGGADEDTITGFESVIGGKGNDTLFGNGFNNQLIGMDGDDKVRGNDGNDLLSGANGHDRLDGGAGNDQIVGGAGGDVLIGGKHTDSFIFADTLDRRENVDKVKDFKHGVDTIVLSHAVFTELDLGALKKKNFALSDNAKDDSDHIVYDESTGKLYYDADGHGGARAVQFATLKGAPGLDGGDFVIV